MGEGEGGWAPEAGRGLEGSQTVYRPRNEEAGLQELRGERPPQWFNVNRAKSGCGAKAPHESTWSNTRTSSR